MSLSLALGSVVAVYAITYLPDLLDYLRSLRPRRPTQVSRQDVVAHRARS